MQHSVMDNMPTNEETTKNEIILHLNTALSQNKDQIIYILHYSLWKV